MNVTSSAKMIIQGIGSYKGVTTVAFGIDRKPITIGFDLEYDTVEYDGEWHRPAVTNFTCSEPGLEYNTTNFYTGYRNYRDASTDTQKAEVYVYAKGNYVTGDVTRYFTIAPREFTPVLELGYTKATYTGEAKYPTVKVKDGDTVIYDSTSNYTKVFTDNDKPGTATVTVTMKGNYKGTASATYQIVAATKSFDVALDEESYENRVFNSWYKYPKAIVKSGGATLVEGADYELSYKDNYNAGTGTIFVSGLGAYAGYTGKTTFTIEPLDLSAGRVTTNIPDMRYTGKTVTPKPTITMMFDWYYYLQEGVGYTATYDNNIQAGVATMTITGKGNYKGTTTLSFNIVDKGTPIVDIASDAVTIDPIYDRDYTGNPIEYDPNVRYNGTLLVRGIDYALAWENNVDPGMATIIITGMNDFKGTTTTTFAIKSSENEKSANPLTATAKAATQTLKYNASAGQTIAASKAYTISGAQGTVSYKKKSGDAGITIGSDGAIIVTRGQSAGSYPVVVTVTAAGNDGYYAGSKDVSFIVKIAKASSTIKLAVQTKTYNGKAQAYTGKVTKAGSTGKVTYAYYGDAKCTKAVKAANVKSVGVYYVKATVAADANYKAATSAAVKLTVIPVGTTQTGLTAASKGFTAKWKKQAAQTTGYQIQYALNSKFTSRAKTVAVKGAKIVSKKITNLKGGTKYYVRVRTYKTVGKTNYYSAWSAAKTVTTKK